MSLKDSKFILNFVLIYKIRQNSTNKCINIYLGDIMNIFDTILLDVILIIFPILFYLIYIFSNKNINKKTKNLIYNISIITSFFLIINYSNNNLINYLLLSVLILISYLKKHISLSIVLTILIIILIKINIIMYIPYISLIILYIIKKHKNISNFIFIDTFMILVLITLLISNYSINNIFIFIISYLVVHIIYLLLNKSEEIIKYHLSYKELQQEKQIRLSLFKVTHEIKNPIAVCKGYLDMLNTNNQEQVEKYIPIIKGEIERLLTLLEDFMLVNKNNVELDIMDINMLLEEVIDKLKPMLEEKNIELENKLIDDEIYINGDYKRLSQVFINLVKNSIEAIPNNKEGLISIKNNINKNNLSITIEDNGVGISSKILKKIKEPFYTTKQRGTGLGVSLSNEIINAHQGTLEYYSKEGLYTKTIVKIPLYKEL